MQLTVDHARRFREAALGVSVRALTVLFGLGTLIGIWPLVSGTEPEAFFAPFIVFLAAATAWQRHAAGAADQSRWLITAVSLLYVLATLSAAPRLIVLAIGYPLAFLLLLLMHLIHPPEQARRLGWVTLVLVAIGGVHVLLEAKLPEEWALASGALTQPLSFAAANIVLGRLGHGWQSALGALEEASQRIAESYQGAKSASEAKSRFLADMSHELRTPLNAILGYSELIEDQLTDEEMPDADDLGRIQRAGRHLLELVNQVLDLSRVEAGYIELQIEPVDLSPLAREVADTLRNQAEHRHTELVVDLDETVPPLPLDLLRMRQVLTNLVSNAVKFTEGGTVTLSVLHGIDGYQILVRDTGTGIAADAVERIFEPFVQADSSVQRTHGGTGLGLAISRQLVRQMGGELSAQSCAGTGATFVVTFPRALAQAGANPLRQSQ